MSLSLNSKWVRTGDEGNLKGKFRNILWFFPDWAGGGEEKKEEQEGGSAGSSHRRGTTYPTAALSLLGSLGAGQVLITF